MEDIKKKREKKANKRRQTGGKGGKERVKGGEVGGDNPKKMEKRVGVGFLALGVCY